MNLTLDDLRTIKFLIERFGEKEIPLFCKGLKRKVEESLSVIEQEEELLRSRVNADWP
jgi:hypothetical protein